MGWRVRLHNRMAKAKLRSALCLVASWTGENAAFSKVVRTCFMIFVNLHLSRVAGALHENAFSQPSAATSGPLRFLFGDLQWKSSTL